MTADWSGRWKEGDWSGRGKGRDWSGRGKERDWSSSDWSWKEDRNPRLIIEGEGPGLVSQANFSKPVLGRIEAERCNQIFMRKGLARSLRLTFLCNSQSLNKLAACRHIFCELQHSFIAKNTRFRIIHS